MNNIPTHHVWKKAFYTPDLIDLTPEQLQKSLDTVHQHKTKRHVYVRLTKEGLERISLMRFIAEKFLGLFRIDHTNRKGIELFERKVMLQVGLQNNDDKEVEKKIRQIGESDKQLSTFSQKILASLGGSTRAREKSLCEARSMLGEYFITQHKNLSSQNPSFLGENALKMIDQASQKKGFSTSNSNDVDFVCSQYREATLYARSSSEYEKILEHLNASFPEVNRPGSLPAIATELEKRVEEAKERENREKQIDAFLDYIPTSSTNSEDGQKSFVAKVRQAYPEVNYYEQSDLKGAIVTAKDEFNKTINSLRCFTWILNDDYDSFVQNQPDQKKLTKESFEVVRGWFLDKIGEEKNREKVHLLFSILAIHDLGKLQHLQDAFRAEPSDDHDTVLRKGLEAKNSLLTSFLSLSKKDQEMITQMWSTDFLGPQMVQGECLSSNLLAIAQMLKEDNTLPLDYMFLQEILDVMGTLAPPQLAAAPFTEETFIAFKMMKEVFAEYNEKAKSESAENLAVALYDAYLTKRGKHTFGDRFDSKDPQQKAAVRLLCALRIFENGSDAQTIATEMKDEKNKKLVDYLNRSGFESDKPAMLGYYLPALLGSFQRKGQLSKGIAFVQDLFDKAEQELVGQGKNGAQVVYLGPVRTYVDSLGDDAIAKLDVDEFQFDQASHTFNKS